MKYEWNAADYRAHSTAQNELAMEIVDALGLRGDEAVLDIGCGDGRVTAELARRVPDGFVVGIDSSASMIEVAQTQDDVPQNVQFEVGDASALEFADAFDVVFSNSALHWVMDHVPVVRGIARALRPGGRFALRMGGQGTAHQVVAAFDGLMAEPAWSGYFEGFAFPYGFHSPEDYAVWLRDAGLEATRVELVPKVAEHTYESFAGWIRTTWLPYTQRVPAELREEFVDEFVSRYLNENTDCTTEKYRVDMTRLDVEGSKAG